MLRITFALLLMSSAALAYRLQGDTEKRDIAAHAEALRNAIRNENAAFQSAGDEEVMQAAENALALRDAARRQEQPAQPVIPFSNEDKMTKMCGDNSVCNCWIWC